jgi:hypothetical protein
MRKPRRRGIQERSRDKSRKAGVQEHLTGKF